MTAWAPLSRRTISIFGAGDYATQPNEYQIVQTDSNYGLSQFMLMQTPLVNGLYGNYPSGQVTACSGIAAKDASLIAISGVTWSGSSPITVTTSSAHGLITGQVVNITGVDGVTAANGTWQVTVPTGSTTQFTLNSSTGSGTYTTNTGKVTYGTALYASDAFTNQVLYANPSPVTYLSPNYINSAGQHIGQIWNNVVPNTIDTSYVTSTAPQGVYQSQFEGYKGNLSFTIPLQPSTTYKVRLHFAEFKETLATHRKMNMFVGSQSMLDYDILAHTKVDSTHFGAVPYQATIVEFTGVQSDASGNLAIWFTPDVGNAVINGIEILDSLGTTTIKDINCGGAAVPSSNWTSTINEVPTSTSGPHTFSFANPGPMVFDGTGNLWIIKEGTTFPASGTSNYTANQAAVFCFDPATGSFISGAEINTGSGGLALENPVGIAYDSTNNRILVADNGPDFQNVQIYSLAGTQFGRDSHVAIRN